MGEPLRLKPEMASRKALALRFIHDFVDGWGLSPSYGEIAAGIGVTRSRVADIVQQLAEAGLILHTPGRHRSIRLPTARDAAIAELLSEGWTIDPESQRLAAPVLDVIDPDLTNPELPGKPPNGHGAGPGDEGSDGGTTDIGRAESDARDDRPH